jgi:hypothetical protein
MEESLKELQAKIGCVKIIEDQARVCLEQIGQIAWLDDSLEIAQASRHAFETTQSLARLRRLLEARMERRMIGQGDVTALAYAKNAGRGVREIPPDQVLQALRTGRVIPIK